MAKPEGFEYSAAGGERVFIYHHGRLAETLSGRAAVDFLMKAETADDHGRQLLMAKATKNYKRGNERAGKQRR